MLKLESIKSEKIWGYELWIASTHPNGCQNDLKNAIGGEYPLLVKIIQANDTLSIQVHPDDEYALKYEGEYGKNEMWYIMDCDKDSYIYYGTIGEISKEELRERIANNTILEVLNKVNVKKGDVFYQTVRPYQKNNCQYTGNDYLHRKAVAENFLRRVVILFSHVNRGSRRTARAYQCRKCRNNYNNRQANTHARQSQAALNGNMPDIYPIDDIIKHIDKLCDYRRNRQL